MYKLLIPLFLLSCNKKESIDETGLFIPPEFSCSHPNTPYEAQIEVSYYEEPQTSKVEVVIEQGDRIIVAQLYKEKRSSQIWSRVIQAFEFDCNKDYEYAFFATQEH
jgi:hypothetical protein